MTEHRWASLPRPVGTVLRSVDERTVDDLWRRHSRGAPRTRWGWPTLAVVSMAVAAYALWVRPTPTGSLRLAAHGVVGPRVPAGEALQFEDGSTITLDDGVASIVENEPGWLVVELVEGTMHIEVTPGGPRRWVVETELGTVSVMGTGFLVELDEGGLSVVVEHGLVRVRSPFLPSSRVDLGAGERVHIDRVRTTTAIAVPTIVVPPSEPTPIEPALEVVAPVRPSVRRIEAPEVPWRRLAEEGDHAAAYASLGPEGIRAARVGARPADLMQLADVARFAGHPRDALIPLEALLSDHPDDRSVPLAAFTLGCIHVDSLGDLQSGERAFERALASGISRSLAEDAWARLADVRERRGETDTACAAARSYLEIAPHGARQAAMERVAGRCP